MRELKVVGLDVDGKRIICESDDPNEKFILRADDRLRAAVRGDKSACQPIPIRCRGSKRAASQGDSGQDSRGRIRRAGRGVGRRRRLPGRAIRASGPAGTLARGRAGNRGASRPCRRSRGAHAAGDRHDGADRPRPGPRRHQLGRVAQRGRPLDGAAVLEGRTVGQRRALPVHPRRARRHGHRVRRRRLRADRPRLRPAAAAGGGSRDSPNRGARAAGAAPRAGTARARRSPPAPHAPARASRRSRRGRTCCSACAPAASASRASTPAGPATRPRRRRRDPARTTATPALRAIPTPSAPVRRRPPC